MKRLVLDQRYVSGFGLGDVEGIKVKIKVEIDSLNERLPDRKLINVNNVDEYDGEEFFSNPYYFDDATTIYYEMSRVVDKAIDKVAPEEYFISLEEGSVSAGFSFTAIGIEDIKVRGDEVIFTMIVDVVYYDVEHYPG